jgi:hypothetical protein
MNTCDKCGYKVVKNSLFEQHMLTHQIDPVIPVVTVAPVEKPAEVTVPQEVFAPAPIAPVVPEKPIVTFNPEEITIRFMKAVEIQINGIHYDGKEVKVKDMSLASEIVRLAREAYGPTILA